MAIRIPEREALIARNERLWRNKEKMRKINATIKYVFYAKLGLSFLNVISALAVTNMFAGMQLSPADCFTFGCVQVVADAMLIIIAYFALGKSSTATTIQIICYITVTALGIIFENISYVLMGIVGVGLYVLESVRLMQIKRLSREDGYPYFNERFEDYEINRDYSPDSYIPPEERTAEMNEITEDEATFNELMTKSVSDVLNTCRPQMDSIETEEISEAEILTEKPFAPPEEVKKHSDAIMELRRRREEKINRLNEKKSEKPLK